MTGFTWPGRAAVLAVLLLIPAAAGAQAADTQDFGTLEDRAAIEATLARYTRGLDRLDADLYLSALAPDAVVAIDGDERRGHDAFRDIIAGEAALREGEPRTLFHMETNSAIDITGPDSAVHTTYWLTMSREGEGQPAKLFDIGSSRDDLRRIDGQWLIVRRDIYLHP